MRSGSGRTAVGSRRDRLDRPVGVALAHGEVADHARARCAVEIVDGVHGKARAEAGLHRRAGVQGARLRRSRGGRALRQHGAGGGDRAAETDSGKAGADQAAAREVGSLRGVVQRCLLQRAGSGATGGGVRPAHGPHGRRPGAPAPGWRVGRRRGSARSSRVRRPRPATGRRRPSRYARAGNP